ncbi:AidA/PixA family protein [Xenorhabdus sp. KJ12.1]|uniref:AidA/PixA family protein n=1 Tax=Xenorhabdus sp. KJ12.1 TaxID=1851571 RepID=UPI000C049115|nr:AidA/PixA family protein [Xenorhabdus sp. KJ12.1]PHM68284.1 methionine-rich PixA inclusion body protein [Xenorhabdus sp. KJ12.1]
MSKMIDILVGIRAEDIMNDFGKLSKDINNPVSLWSEDIFKKYITYIPEDDRLASVNSSGNLVIKCDAGDMLRVKVMTLNMNLDYSVALIKLDSMMNVMPDDMMTMIEPHKVVQGIEYIPVVDVRNPLDVNMQSIRNYYWMSKVNMMPANGTMRTMYYECIVGIYKEGILQGYVAAEPALILDKR